MQGNRKFEFSGFVLCCEWGSGRTSLCTVITHECQRVCDFLCTFIFNPCQCWGTCGAGVWGINLRTWNAAQSEGLLNMSCMAVRMRDGAIRISECVYTISLSLSLARSLSTRPLFWSTTRRDLGGRGGAIIDENSSCASSLYIQATGTFAFVKKP